MALLIVLYTGINLCVCARVCLPPGNDVKYSAIVKAFERNSRDYLFTLSTVSYLYSFPTLSLLLLLLLPLLLFFYRQYLNPGSKKYVALLTIRPLRRVSVSAFEGFQGYFAGNGFTPLRRFSFFIVSSPPEGNFLSFTLDMIKLFYSFSSIFFFFLVFFFFFPLAIHGKTTRYISESGAYL